MISFDMGVIYYSRILCVNKFIMTEKMGMGNTMICDYCGEEAKGPKERLYHVVYWIYSRNVLQLLTERET